MKMKAIKPKPINRQAMLREIRNGVFSQAKFVEEEYTRTVATWKTRVKFIVELKETFSSYEFFVGTDNQLYYMVDVTGAEPHPIFPKTAKALAVPTGFTPKTKVGVIGSQAGGRFGAVQARASVKHPGFKARKFTEVIAKRTEQRFTNGMKVTMRAVVRASGHTL